MQRILLIEDEEHVALFIKKGLEEENYKVEVAYNGKQGLDIALKENFNMIIVDLMLPEIDGITICKKIREKNIFIPILILTVKSDIKDKVNGFKSGANDYLTKPFYFEELICRIKNLLGDNKEKIIIKDLEIDLTTNTVTRAGKEIFLSPKEFMLFKYLIKNQGKILSRKILTKEVWGEEFDENVVNVYINYLRNKIDKDFKPKIIRTVRGSGYMIKF